MYLRRLLQVLLLAVLLTAFVLNEAEGFLRRRPRYGKKGGRQKGRGRHKAPSKDFIRGLKLFEKTIKSMDKQPTHKGYHDSCSRKSHRSSPQYHQRSHHNNYYRPPPYGPSYSSSYGPYAPMPPMYSDPGPMYDRSYGSPPPSPMFGPVYYHGPPDPYGGGHYHWYPSYHHSYDQSHDHSYAAKEKSKTKKAFGQLKKVHHRKAHRKSDNADTIEGEQYTQKDQLGVPNSVQQGEYGSTITITEPDMEEQYSYPPLYYPESGPQTKTNDQDHRNRRRSWESRRPHQMHAEGSVNLYRPALPSQSEQIKTTNANKNFLDGEFHSSAELLGSARPQFSFQKLDSSYTFYDASNVGSTSIEEEDWQGYNWNPTEIISLTDGVQEKANIEPVTG